MIQNPQYADWGLECRACWGFVPLPDDVEELDAVKCPTCGAATSTEILAVAS